MLEVDSLFDDLAQTVCKGRVADFLRFFRLVNQGEMASEMEYLVHLEKCPKCAAAVRVAGERIAESLENLAREIRSAK